MKHLNMNSLILILTYSLSLIHKSSTLHPQYGFCHRVNNPDHIDSVLRNGANAIEIDICYGKDTNQIEDWYVSHNDLSVCNNIDAVLLTVWLRHLECVLSNNPSYLTQFAMLWLDIKNPSQPRLNQVPKIVQSMGLHSHMKILYDLTGYNSESRAGFDAIVQRLHSNEGVTFCAGKSCKGSQGTVRDIYEFYKSKGFLRGTFNTGDSLNVDEDYLIYANSRQFNERLDPFRFKLVLSWTHNKKDEIEGQINPKRPYHNDGQIFGTWAKGWSDGNDKYIQMFLDSVNKYNTEERVATSNDNPWQDYNRHSNDDNNGDFLVDGNGDYMYITNSSYIALKSHRYNTYVSVYRNGSMDISASELTKSEKFVRYEVGNINYLLHVSSYFVSALNGFKVFADAEWPMNWQKWEVIRNGDGTVAFKSFHGRYLSAFANNKLEASAESVSSDSQKFVLEPWWNWIDPSETNMSTTSAESATDYPSVMPTECPTKWPTEDLTQEEKGWFLSAVVFICLSTVSSMIICYLGYALCRRKKEEKAQNDKLGKYERAETVELEVEAGVINTTE